MKSIKRQESATIKSMIGSYAEIQFPGAVTTIKNVETIGGVVPGSEVSIIWKDNRPVALGTVSGNVSVTDLSGGANYFPDNSQGDALTVHGSLGVTLVTDNYLNGGGLLNTAFVTISANASEHPLANQLVATDSAGRIDVVGGALGNFSFTETLFKSENFVSMVSGIGISDDGTADFRRLFASEMSTMSFKTDLQRAVNGSEIVCKSSGMLNEAFTLPAASASGAFQVKGFDDAPYTPIFENGDVIRFRTHSRSGGLSWADAWGTVTQTSGSEQMFTDNDFELANESGELLYGESYYTSSGQVQHWLFTRDAAPYSGSATGDVTGLALDYGVANTGIVETSAGNDFSPYVQTSRWSIHPSNMLATARLGNLGDITGTSGEYGIFAGNYAQKRYAVISDQKADFHGIDLTLYDGSDAVFKIDHSVPSLAMGSTIPGYMTGNGFWVGKDGQDYKFKLGKVENSALTEGITWDGSVLTVKGAITVTGGNAATLEYGNKRRIVGVSGSFAKSTGYAVATSGFYVHLADGSTKTIANASYSLNTTPGVKIFFYINVTEVNPVEMFATLDPENIGADCVLVAFVSGDGVNNSSITVQIIGGGTMISGDWINTGSITATKMNVSELSSISANIGTITSGTIKISEFSDTGKYNFEADGNGFRAAWDGDNSVHRLTVTNDGTLTLRGKINLNSGQIGNRVFITDDNFILGCSDVGNYWATEGSYNLKLMRYAGLDGEGNPNPYILTNGLIAGLNEWASNDGQFSLGPVLSMTSGERGGQYDTYDNVRSGPAIRLYTRGNDSGVTQMDRILALNGYNPHFAVEYRGRSGTDIYRRIGMTQDVIYTKQGVDWIMRFIGGIYIASKSAADVYANGWGEYAIPAGQW